MDSVLRESISSPSKCSSLAIDIYSERRSTITAIWIGVALLFISGALLAINLLNLVGSIWIFFTYLLLLMTVLSGFGLIAQGLFDLRVINKIISGEYQISNQMSNAKNVMAKE